MCCTCSWNLTFQVPNTCSPSPFALHPHTLELWKMLGVVAPWSHSTSNFITQNGCQYKLATQCAMPTSRGSLACGMSHTPPLRLSFQTMRNQTRHDAGYVHDPSEFLIVTALAIMWWFGKSTKVTPRTVACLTCDVIGRACERTSAINGKALNGP